MTKPVPAVYKKSVGLILAAWIAASPVNTAEAFERFSHLKGISKKCQTSCHLPENIVRAKADKTRLSSCKACHGGDAVPYSPFRSAPRMLRIAGPSGIEKTVIPPAKTLRSKLKKQAKKEFHGENRSPASQPPPDMVYISAGEFIMGSNERWDDEAPEHIAPTGAYFIDIYEVSNRAYKKFANATNKETPYHWPNGEIPEGKENHPVVYVNWTDAVSYCKWAGKRLPTEREWEKAARGEEGNIYPWGNIWDLDKSNNPYKHSTGTEPVGSYPKGRSPYGLYNMSGNVWEWVNSYYLPHPGNTIPRREYGQNNRVLKGGSWFDCLSYGCGLSAPTFNRSFFTPEVRNNSFGFRCAQTPEKRTAQTNPEE